MKNKGISLNGWIALDKPYGLGSTQAVGKVRRILNAAKIGHGGTLDPLATGILPIALGEATKTIPFIVDHLKTYTFTVIWGEQRNTDDAEGSVIATSPNRPTDEQIRSILPRFIGEIEQVPPQFSAIKIDGERAYDIARGGSDIEMKARGVYVESLELIKASSPLLLAGGGTQGGGPSPSNSPSLEREGENASATFRCVCGPGTYIRSLGRDMAQALGTAGYIGALHRDRVGPFGPENAISLEKLEEIGDSALLPVESVLDGIPALKVSKQEAARLKHGQVLSFISRPDVERLKSLDFHPSDNTALAVCDGAPVALVTVDGIDVRPARVLNL